MAEFQDKQHEESVNNVCEFLENRNVSHTVIENFRKNSMDELAVWNSTETDLEQLGLTEKGHLICLKGFCIGKSSSENKKEELVSALAFSGKDRISNQSGKRKRNTLFKSITLGLMNFDTKQNRYISVRGYSKGGGTRTVDVPNDADVNSIMNIAQNLFFPDSKSLLGSEDEYNLKLGNFQSDVIEDENFTLNSYIQKYKFTKTRLYLLCKKKTKLQCLLQKCITFSESEDEDKEFEVSPFSHQICSTDEDSSYVEPLPSTSLHDEQTNDSINSYTPVYERTRRVVNKPMRYRHSIGSPALTENIARETLLNNALPGSSLIGTNSEREELRNQIYNDYKISEMEDREKEERKKKAGELEEKKLILQSERAKRVPPEPSLTDDHVVVSVRHTQCGTLRRIFKTERTFETVYDWIGSITPDPMYFNIMDGNEIIIKSCKVWAYDKKVLNMLVTETPSVCEEQTPSSSKTTYDSFSYADEEAGRITVQVDDEPDCPLVNIDCNCSIELFLKQHNSPSRDNVKNTVICHRRPISFWKVLFRQKVDFSIPFRVVWAGENSSDDGGPYREFLLYCMELLRVLTSHFFGSSNELMFTSFTDAVIKKHYYILGQLAALAILNIGRGPQCFHSVVVDAMFSLSRKNSIKNIENAEFEFKSNQILNGDKEFLLEANINPTEDPEKDLDAFKEYFCIISRLAGIDQFRQGILSVNSDLIKKGCCVKKYFLQETHSIKLGDVRKIIKFVTGEPGSNENLSCEEAIIEFEMFLASLAQNNDEGLQLKDFLIFVAGVDRIPAFGLPKDIEIFFVNDSKLPRVSTCGLFMQIPKSITAATLRFCTKEGIGFGLL